MLEDLLALITSGGGTTAICRSPGRPEVNRARLTEDIRDFALTVAAAPRRGPDGASAWVSARDPYLMLVAALGCLHAGPAAVLEAEGPAAAFDTLAAVCPPALVVCDVADADMVRWARARELPTVIIDREALDVRPAGPGASAADGAVLQFFSSGTTGTPKCVSIGAAPLKSAITGVAGRLALTPGDISLAIAPLSHTLGLITTVLVALASGGAVAFADPHRPRDFLASLAELRPSWCAASPSSHQLVYRLLSGAQQPWPGLRFLRGSAAPLADELAERLENYYAAPLINAYVMTEAPGEIASQPLAGPRPRGTVGRPSLCEVQVMSASRPAPPATAGEIWIRGPNVVGGLPAAGPGGPAGPGWFPTGDIGATDEAGFLRITGRVHDIINTGGLKIWPSQVEAAARTDPAVGTAVAFPVPHVGLGESVGLAVVAAAGQVVDRAGLRRRLMAELPRHAWPGSIVVCADIPRSARGKIQRAVLWQQLPGIRPRSGS